MRQYLEPIQKGVRTLNGASGGVGDPRRARFSQRLLDRRTFVRRIAAVGLGAAAPAIVRSSALGAPGASPSDRVTVGFIGVGWKGLRGCFGSLVQCFTANPACQALAVCDVDSKRCQEAKAFVDKHYGNSDCATYKDFRGLLARGDINAVVVATPPHWHAIQTILACQAGKDVYCEKPLSLTIREARAMVEAARRYGRVVQTGSQSRSYANIRYICEAIREGRIGQVREIHARCGGPPVRCDLPAEQQPDSIDWDLWLGPAPSRPYHSQLASVGWRPYRDYDGGGMTDWGCHHFDLGQWALGMDDSGPVEVHPPDGTEYKWLTYKYANGTIMTHNSGASDRGVLFVGTEGKVAGTAMSNIWQTEPRERFDLPPGMPSRDAGTKANTDNFLECVRSRKRPNADVEIGCRTATVSHLGNIAYWLGRPIRWDPAAEQIVGDEEAARLLDRANRQPWNV